jgi:hypothetical protein
LPLKAPALGLAAAGTSSCIGFSWLDEAVRCTRSERH